MKEEFTITDRPSLEYAFKRINLYKKEFDKILTLKVMPFRRSKTSAQHRCYWRCIGELKKAFREMGSIYNEDQIHNFIKIASGFTEVVEGKTIPKSIADNSDDATLKGLQYLIDFMCQFAIENLNYAINIGD